MKKVLFSLLLFSIFFVSCNNKSNVGLPPSTGAASELLVIMKNSKWDSALGDSLRMLFSAPQRGLNQAEPMFDLSQINQDEFKGLFEKNRKIIRFNISDSVKTESIGARKNVKSSPQIIVEVNAKTDSAAFVIVKSRFASIVTMLRETEYQRINSAFASTANVSLKEGMAKNFGFFCTMPESFFKAKQTDIFAWYRLEHSKYSQAMLVYVNDFVDSSQFVANNIITTRNNVCKANIPGSVPGSYMSTDTTHFIPIVDTVLFANSIAVETRGLWNVVGDFMGGPFLSYTFLDKTKKKVITLDSYVYYPNKDKRDLLLQLEAIMHSFTYADSQEK